MRTLLKALVIFFSLMILSEVGYSQRSERYLQNRNLIIRYDSVTCDGATIYSPGSFELLNGKEVKWTQQKVERVYSYKILNVDGDFDESNRYGSMTLKVRFDKINGTFSIQRNMNGLEAYMNFTTRSGANLNYRLIVNEIISR